MLGAAVHEHAQVAVPVVPFESATQMAQIDAQLKPSVPARGTGTGTGTVPVRCGRTAVVLIRM